MPACTVQIEQIMCPMKVFGFKNTEKIRMLCRFKWESEWCGRKMSV